MKLIQPCACNLSHMVQNGKKSAVVWNSDLVDQINYQMMWNTYFCKNDFTKSCHNVIFWKMIESPLLVNGQKLFGAFTLFAFAMICFTSYHVIINSQFTKTPEFSNIFRVCVQN